MGEMVTIGIALLMFLTLPGELTSSPNFMLEKRAKQSYLEEDPLSITVENKASTATNITTEEKEKAASYYLKQKPPGNSYLEGPAVEPAPNFHLKQEETRKPYLEGPHVPLMESNFSLKQPPSGNPYLEGPHVKLEGLESPKKESSVVQTNNFYLKQKPTGNSYL